MAVTPTVAVQMQFSGLSGAWTDVTSDVRTTVPLAVRYGMLGTDPTDRVAAAGTFVFALDNTTGNAGGKVGYYSPGHRNCRPGFGYSIGVRLAITYSGTTYYKFSGLLDQIQPTGGVHGPRLTQCVAVDFMDEAARFRLRGIAAQIDQRGDEIVSTILAAMPIQPAATSIATTIDTFPYSLDTTKDGQTTALTEFNKVALSELGYIYVKGDTTQGGTFTVESRHTRSSKVTNSSTLTDTMVDVEAVRDRDELLNAVDVTVRPRRVSGSTVVLFTLTSEVVVPPNGASLTIVCPYSDPDNNAERIGGINMIAPVAVTDYTAVDEALPALSLTNSVSVLASFGGNTATVTFTNAHPTESALIDFFQLRGEGLFAFSSEGVLLQAEDTDSQAALGENGVSFEMPYQSDSNTGQGAADYLLNLYSDPRTTARGVRFAANASSALMTAALAREIGDRVGIEETVTGLTDDVEWKDQFQESTSGSLFFNQSTGRQRSGQGVKANPGEITRYEVLIQRVGSPTGVIWVELQSDSAGNPSGTALATSVLINSADIPASAGWVSFGFASPYNNGSAATQYHVVLRTTASIDGSNYFVIFDAFGSYANGNLKRYNGTSWTDESTDMAFRLYVKSTTATRGYFISGIELEVQQASIVSCRWLLTPADATRYWNLETAGATELDATTVLAYV